MLERVRDYIDSHQLMQSGQSVLVGVSGGVDSMVLLHVLLELGYDVQVAHVNYQLRQAESQTDEVLVRQYCVVKNVPFHALRADPALKEEAGGQSFQDRARTVRYTFFEDKARSLHIDRIAVAHHLDDQAETILLKLIKGSGLEGIGSMRPIRTLSLESPAALIRPLLEQSREAILAYAAEHSIPWREDASNASDAYQRNVMRNRIIPLMKEHFGAAVPANLARSAAIFQGYWDHTLRPELETRVARCFSKPGRVDIKTLTEQPDAWRLRVAIEILHAWLPGYEVSKPMAEALVELADVQVGRKIVLASGTVWRERDALVFVRTKEDSLSQDEIVLHELSNENTIVFFGGILDISMQIEVPESLSVSDPNIILADTDSLALPLSVRPWRAGDRMVPFGMAGHKKVSDLLTDAKIPSHQRASTCVLEANGEVVWVLGVRMADRLRVTRNTQQVARMEFRPNRFKV